MRFRTAIVLGFLLAVTIATAAPQGAAAAASRQQADSLARKITQITQRGSQAPGSVVRRTEVSEDEVNSWFEFRGRPYLPSGVTSPTVAMLGDGSMRGVATVDLEALGKRRSRGGALDLWSYLGGKLPLSVTGILHTKDGKGRFELQAAELSDVPVPTGLVQELVSYYSRTPEQPQGVRIDDPFELPAKIKQIEVGSAQAVVVQ